MHISVNNVRLYFDVEGAGLVPDGPRMREKPTLVLLHGGPGFDHTIYKPFFSQLTDIAQVIYLDHRGNGRSDDGPRELWTLAQWGDDVRAFCESLGIEKPIVWGTSFGGMVAIAYATRHPDHPGKLAFVSTEAKGDSYIDRRIALFERLGGPEAGALARRRFRDGDIGPEVLAAWLTVAMPLYTRSPRNPEAAQRAIRKVPVREWFTRAESEGHSFDFLSALSRVQCPTLVMGGDEDPMIPIEAQADIAAAVPSHLVRFERFANCGHGVIADDPERASKVIREFVLS
jgi:pimeloyl-ACP methyl ester carboxylesterase